MVELSILLYYYNKLQRIYFCFMDELSNSFRKSWHWHVNYCEVKFYLLWLFI